MSIMATETSIANKQVTHRVASIFCRGRLSRENCRHSSTSLTAASLVLFAMFTFTRHPTGEGTRRRKCQTRQEDTKTSGMLDFLWGVVLQLCYSTRPFVVGRVWKCENRPEFVRLIAHDDAFESPLSSCKHEEHLEKIFCPCWHKHENH